MIFQEYTIISWYNARRITILKATGFWPLILKVKKKKKKQFIEVFQKISKLQLWGLEPKIMYWVLGLA